MTSPLSAAELDDYRKLDVATVFFARAGIEGFISEDYTGPEIRSFFPEHGAGRGVRGDQRVDDPRRRTRRTSTSSTTTSGSRRSRDRSSP